MQRGGGRGLPKNRNEDSYTDPATFQWNTTISDCTRRPESSRLDGSSARFTSGRRPSKQGSRCRRRANHMCTCVLHRCVRHCQRSSTFLGNTMRRKMNMISISELRTTSYLPICEHRHHGICEACRVVVGRIRHTIRHQGFLVQHRLDPLDQRHQKVPRQRQHLHQG